VEPTRILIVGLPAILRDIVLATCSGEPAIEVLGVVERGADIASEVARTRATLVIAGASGEEPELAPSPLLRRSAPPRSGADGLMVLTPGGREAYLQAALGEISPALLVEAIRQLRNIQPVD